MNRFLMENGIFATMNSTFVVANRAVGGTTSVWAVTQLNSLLSDIEQYRHLDLVIVDYDITDCYEMHDSPLEQTRVMAVTELLVRRILAHPKKPAVMFTNVAVSSSKEMKGDCGIHNTCYSIGEIRERVLSIYGVPLISQKYAIWSNFSCPLGKHWPCKLFCSHPFSAGHALVTSLVSAFLTNTSTQYIPRESIFGDIYTRTEPSSLSIQSHMAPSTFGRVSNTSFSLPLPYEMPYLLETTPTLDRQICSDPSLGNSPVDIARFPHTSSVKQPAQLTLVFFVFLGIDGLVPVLDGSNTSYYLKHVMDNDRVPISTITYSTVFKGDNSNNNSNNSSNGSGRSSNESHPNLVINNTVSAILGRFTIRDVKLGLNFRSASIRPFKIPPLCTYPPPPPYPLHGTQLQDTHTFSQPSTHKYTTQSFSRPSLKSLS